MAKLKGVSKLKLNKLIKALPVPVQEHCKRCKKIASYFVERVSTEDWFIESELKSANLISAVFYHDIGKCALPKDTIYLEHCNSSQKKEKYRSHVNEGIVLIEKESEITFDSFKETSFEKTLYYAITEHHERIDGSGFPNGKSKETLSFIGKLTAVDTFDNLLFVGNSNVIDFDTAIAEIKKQSGLLLDEKIVNVFTSDEETFRSFVEYINVREKDNHRKNRYGIQLRYRPVMNIRDNRTDAYLSDLVINDPYYGTMTSNLFIPIAEKAGMVSQLEKIGFEKLCINLEKMYFRGLPVPDVIFPFSARQLEKKNFFKDIAKLIKKYGINPAKLSFMMTEASLTDYTADLVKAVNETHALGAEFIIGDFGDQVSLISTHEDIQIDGIIFKKSYGNKISVNPKTYSIVSGIARIAEKLNIRVIYDGIDDGRGEESAVKMGGKYASGSRYGSSLNDKELIDLIKQGGVTDG